MKKFCYECGKLMVSAGDSQSNQYGLCNKCKTKSTEAKEIKK